MFWIRFRSSVMLMIITTASLLIGRELLFGILVLISLIGMTELYQVVGMKKSLPAMALYKKSRILFSVRNYIFISIDVHIYHLFSKISFRTDYDDLFWFLLCSSYVNVYLSG